MVTLNSIRPAEGSSRKSIRRGRGQGSGMGCTGGHGNNGARARSGYNYKPYFEGGQTPLSRRSPKRGFASPFHQSCQIVNVGDLDKATLPDKEIDSHWLFENGYIQSADLPVKIQGNGELTKKVLIKASGFSKGAREKIEKAKGKAEVVKP
jgi:large subunit ribosomal protein L15